MHGLEVVLDEQRISRHDRDVESVQSGVERSFSKRVKGIAVPTIGRFQATSNSPVQ